jgi:hypothetical protein
MWLWLLSVRWFRHCWRCCGCCSSCRSCTFRLTFLHCCCSCTTLADRGRPRWRDSLRPTPIRYTEAVGLPSGVRSAVLAPARRCTPRHQAAKRPAGRRRDLPSHRFRYARVRRGDGTVAHVSARRTNVRSLPWVCLTFTCLLRLFDNLFELPQGLARSLNTSRSLTQGVGTVHYMPPEAMDPSALDPSEYDKRRFAPAADVYSFGILISTVFNLKEPYDKLPTFAIMAGVLAGQLRPVLPECLADEVRCVRGKRV